jgi:GTP-binding protein
VRADAGSSFGKARGLYTTAVTHYSVAEFLTSAAHSSQFPADSGSEVAFAGRSNAGKSSAINAIVGRRGLARVSKTPGRTRLLNFFQLRDNERLVDLPGYGYAEASQAEKRTWEPMTTALATRQSLRGLFVIVDSRRGVMEGDIQLLEWAEAAAQPVHVLLSKSDKLKSRELQQNMKSSQTALAGRATLQAFSAHDNTGVEAARARLDEWLADKKLPR